MVASLSHGQKLTTLYSFTTAGGTNGNYPVGALVQGSDSNFYGATEYGGMNNSGTVFKITSAGTLNVLYDFTGGTDGSYPVAGLVQGIDGNFYGTTYFGGTYHFGTVFKVSSTGMLATLYSFTGGSDGGYPAAALVQGIDTNFYGTTSSAGFGAGYGTVFKITTAGTLTTLYTFPNVEIGEIPSGLVQDSVGNVYGTTQEGGTYGVVPTFGYGTVFDVGTAYPGGGYDHIYTFTGGDDGAYPVAALVQDRSAYGWATFYGTAEYGGERGLGTVFEITSAGTFGMVYSFTGGSDGGSPQSALVWGSDDNLYGTTSGYDLTNGAPARYGTVFRLSTVAPGGLTTLYSFSGGGDGKTPSGLVLGSDGSFYGTTSGDITNNYGTVFQILAIPPTITTTNPLPNGTVGTAYSVTLQATGGTPPYTWAVMSGSLPSGFSLSTNGVLSGTPGSVNSFHFAVQVTDINGLASSKGFDLTILPQVATPVIIPSGGTFMNSTLVFMACTTPDATIRYTTDGTDPTTTSIMYSNAFMLINSATVQAKAFLSGYTDSLIASAAFTIVCGYAISPTNLTCDAVAESGTVTVTAGPACAWTATSNDGFITITSGSSESGNGSVSYTVAANTSTTPLTGTMTIAGQTFTVSQSGLSCSVSPVSTSASFTAAGGTSNVTVTANATNCAWMATSNSGFITITDGSSGSGNGSVSYTVAANSNSIGQTGSMTIAGQTFTVTQSGVVSPTCTFTLGATSIDMPAKGGTKTVKLKAKGTDCSWTAVSNDSFITIRSGSTGTGNGTIRFSVPGNTNTVPLTGTITIADQIFTVSQAAGGCTFSLSPKDGKFKAAGGSKTVKVKPNFSDCAWTAVSNDSFITITDGASGIGKGTVSYMVAAKTNTTALTGSITIAGETFTITQAGEK